VCTGQRSLALGILHCQVSAKQRLLKMRRTSWCLALALLAIAPGVGSAANQCTVSDGVVGVPDGPAKYLGIGPVGLAAPQVVFGPPQLAGLASETRL